MRVGTSEPDDDGRQYGINNMVGFIHSSCTFQARGTFDNVIQLQILTEVDCCLACMYVFVRDIFTLFTHLFCLLELRIYDVFELRSRTTSSAATVWHQYQNHCELSTNR